MELFETIGQVQNNGGLLAMMALMWWQQSKHRKDFEQHGHDTKTGTPVIKI